MTYDEALTECVAGMRVTCDTMQAGCYVEHSFKRGFIRCWPVDRVEDEPSRTQCDFIATAAERNDVWREHERPKLDSWGKPIDAAYFAKLDTERDAPHVEVKPQRSKWGQQSEASALIAIEQQRVKIADIPVQHVQAPTETPPYTGPDMSAWGKPAVDKWGRPL